ncbi:MAG: NADH:ubiquinone oxidoreductase [Bacteroidetes bacterium RIFOXYA12_FULL_35_11]|nr:MAG: NADH:ubiquinone oxidoreductase [Bacteroidetes bacterium GWF2_35_48]OFY72662.1 MAG: NADH:ubiquinone oxidoreductase [Bacteroidetes bacterium RIFOXYA12_FULL_35_11]HBX50170.1 NADH:ubiquinone oxidoreductase [Bacteroidales bacterium]
MISNIKILYHQGKQFIPDVTTVEVPGIFRGRPIISVNKIDENLLRELCPTEAIATNPVSIDLGKCTFCGACAAKFPDKISFTKEYKLSVNKREDLIIYEGVDKPLVLDENRIRKEIRSMFGGSLKLRQISAAGDNSCEWELNAAGNVNFDMGRFGIEFVASPRHADGIVITGPISENMAEPTQICYDATPDPKIIILAGTDAISGGIFSGAPALNRSFLDKYPIDLYIAGNPVHPLAFINGVLALIRKKKK